MPMPTVDKIANVSFKDHFLAADGVKPQNGRIQVNHNTFDVTFADGKVNARFVSGNWFTNLFRSNTLSRFTQTLQAQYDSMVADQMKAGGFKNNPNTGAVDKAIDSIIDILYDNREKIDSGGIQYPKEIMKAYAMPDAYVALSDEGVERLERILAGDTMPPNMSKLLTRLGEIGKLAALRNQLTNIPSGMECDRLVCAAGFMTHTADNNVGKSEQEIKRYVLNMIDTVIDGFLSAVNGMTDKNTQAIDFLRKLDGACVEAKSDNIQNYIERAMNIASAGRSEEKDDLAYSATAEFNVLADEVKAPFREAARKECEAAVRVKCAADGITDAEAIESCITNKVEEILLSKNDDIAPLIRKKLEAEGKSALYENLCGALRPITSVSKENDKWTVTTLVDKEGKPFKKPVSAFDIDKNFDKFVDMYMEDALVMGLVENKTRTVSKVKFATKQDMCAKGVIDAAKYFSGNADEMAKLVRTVRKEVHSGIDMPDDKFEEAVRKVMRDIITTEALDDNDTDVNFKRFVANFGTAAYKDKINDGERLVFLLARGVEHSRGDRAANVLADLDAKAARCAHMLKFTFKDKIVDVAKAKAAIAKTIEAMVERGIKPKDGQKVSVSCKENLNKIMFNGRLFTDNFDYDMGHRAGGHAESTLHKGFGTLLLCIEHYGKIDRSEFIRDPGQKEGVAA